MARAQSTCEFFVTISSSGLYDGRENGRCIVLTFHSWLSLFIDPFSRLFLAIYFRHLF